jgi:hypothetical protein
MNQFNMILKEFKDITRNFLEFELENIEYYMKWILKII